MNPQPDQRRHLQHIHNLVDDLRLLWDWLMREHGVDLNTLLAQLRRDAKQ